MIKQVRSYQTTDGELHSDRAAALHHQYFLDVRGVLQRNLGPQGNVTPSMASQIFVKESDDIFQLTSKYRAALSRIKG